MKTISTSATAMFEQLFDHPMENIDMVNCTIAGSLYAKQHQEIERQLPELKTGYHKGDKIAEGGMSNIYLGEQRSLGRRVAIKENKSSSSLNDVLLHESLITARLEHPNIMPIYDIVQVEDHYQVVLKLLEGFTLSEKLDEWREYEMEVEHSIPVLLKVCDAVAYAHDKGILHRDIKSENIMIGDHGAIYLLDWGIALDTNDKASSPNMVVGTLSYMAPEMMSDKPIDSVSEQSDIFLLGATLHEIITGEKRHNSPVPNTVIQQVIECEPKEYDEEYQLLGSICNKACHKDPKKRYKSVRHFAHALQGALDVWKQRFLLDQGLAMLEELQAIDQGQFVPGTNAHIFQLYMQIRAAFGGYMLLDSNSAIANEGLRQAGIIMMRHCIAEKELTSAKWMFESVSHVPEDLKQALQDLEQAIEHQAEEDRIIKTLSTVTQRISSEVSELNADLKTIRSKQVYFVIGFLVVLCLLGWIAFSVG